MGDAITNPSPPIRKIIQAIIVKAMPEAATPRYIQCTVTAPPGDGEARGEKGLSGDRGMRFFTAIGRPFLSIAPHYPECVFYLVCSFITACRFFSIISGYVYSLASSLQGYLYT